MKLNFDLRARLPNFINYSGFFGNWYIGLMKSSCGSGFSFHKVPSDRTTYFYSFHVDRYSLMLFRDKDAKQIS